MVAGQKMNAVKIFLVFLETVLTFLDFPFWFPDFLEFLDIFTKTGCREKAIRAAGPSARNQEIQENQENTMKYQEKRGQGWTAKRNAGCQASRCCIEPSIPDLDFLDRSLCFLAFLDFLDFPGKPRRPEWLDGHRSTFS